MSRIVALLNRDGRPADREILQKLIATLRHKATDGPRFWIGSHAGLAYQCLRTSSTLDELQPLTDPARIAVCFDGRLDNRGELLQMLRDDVTADPAELSDASLVLACYRRFGETFAKHLNGDYALTLWDEPQGRLLLARDVIGIRPLYYWSSGDTAIAASEIKAILAHPRVEARPDDDALADFLIGGDPNEVRLTCFRDIHRVLPGHTVTITPERIQERKHWDFDPTRQIRLGSVDEYAEALRDIFEQSVRRRLRTRGPVAVTVSGGLDSSAVLCQAQKLRQAGAPVAQTVGVSLVFPDATPADEKCYLADIEKMYGIGIHRLPFASFQYMDDPQWLWSSEFPRLLWDSGTETFRTARELGCSQLIDGDYGDNVISSFASLFDLARSFRWIRVIQGFRALSASMTDCPPKTLARDLLRPFLRDQISDRLMVPIRTLRWFWSRDRSQQWYTRSLRELAYRRSQQQLRLAGPFATKHAELLYRYFHRFHVVEAFEEVNKLAAGFAMDYACPFVNQDLLAFIMAIPAEIVNWQGAYKGLFRKAMRGILPESIRLRYWKADFTPIDSGAASTGLARFLKLFRPDCLAVQFGYVNPSTVEDALAQHKHKLTGERLGPSMQINKLIALELWLQAFFGPKSSDQYADARLVYQNGYRS
jgi:asparagine synthase (glutamine-hydrolysing)